MTARDQSVRKPEAPGARAASDMHDLIDRAERYLGIQDPRAWYQDARLAEFQYLTPADLVRAGRAGELKRYLEHTFGIDHRN